MSISSPEEAKIRATEIAGYAIISDDNKIAGPDGFLPPSMRATKKTAENHQRALAGSDLIASAIAATNSSLTSGATGVS